MKLYKILLVGALTALGIFQASTQNITSPYSRYGYGLLNDNATSAQRAMGGVGYAMNSGRQINVMNPASYAAIDSLTFLFDLGLDLNNLWTSEGDQKGKKLGGGLDYITLQVPITKYGGASVGFLPYSQVGYSFGDAIDNGRAAYQGSGGISQLYLGLAARPFKGFSVGINISYMFGTITNDNYSYTNTGSIGLFQRVIDVQDYHLEIGAQYSFNINRLNRVTIGAVFAPGKSFHGKSYGVQYDSSNEQAPDTIGYVSMKNNYTEPFTLGGGLNWQWNDRLMIEVDAMMQPWSKAKYASIDGMGNYRFVNRYKAGIGAQYCVNPRGDYLHRIQYRLGFSATRDYLYLQGNTLREYGIHAGFGLPVPAGKTMINLSLSYQWRNSVPRPLIKEKYLFVTLGINFNELWFWQNKIR